MTSRWTAWASVALLLGTQACLASKNDIRLLQDELRVTRAAEAHADSARAAQGDSLRRLIVAAQERQQQDEAQTTASFSDQLRLLRATSDSLRVLSGRLVNSLANLQETQEEIGKMVVALTSLSQAQGNRIAGLGQAVEGFEQHVGANAAAQAAGDTSGAHPTDPGIPPPYRLFKDARDQYQLSAFGTAQGMFDDFLRAYPNDPSASSAQFYVGEAYKALGNPQAADSVYKLVVLRYPKSDEAATALVREAKAACDAGRPADAKKLFQQVVAQFSLATATAYPEAAARVKQANPCAA